MRLLVVVLGCSLLLAVHAARGGPSAPMTVYVTEDGISVRSGPGENYYPTERLKLGQPVEVYRVDPGGWCAVRPVEGSFTWVSRRHLKPTENNLAVVTADNVPACVGSSLSDARDVVQVRLRKGELVEVLDRLPGEAKNDQENAWVKIAPPSGEFRWVAGEYLDSVPPQGAPRGAGPVQQTARSVSAPAPQGGDRQARDERPPTAALSPQAFQKELDRLEMELSSTVAEETTFWSFESLRDRANWLLDRAQTAVERGRARALVNRIARFDDIKQRYDSARDPNARPPRLLASLPVQGDGKGSRSSDAEDRFDGVGRLSAVESPTLGAPRYALLNEDGGVRCYVTPAPGLNLRGYVGKQVGVTGTRGYMPEQRANHLVARHIAVLDGNLLR
jgi:uncharacterized protein YgiM (DUF1202 family)